MTPASLTAVARRLLGITETLGPNRGFWVGFFQRFSGGALGESWCADFLSFVLDVAYQGKPPLPRSGATLVLLTKAKNSGWVVDGPRTDDLYFFLRPDGTPHHVGIVTGTQPLTGIAGNTSRDGTSSDGTGVFEHAIPLDGTVFARLPGGAA